MKLKALIFLSILVVAVGCINGDGTDTTETPADTTGGPTDTHTTTTTETPSPPTTTEYEGFDEEGS